MGTVYNIGMNLRASGNISFLLSVYIYNNAYVLSILAIEFLKIMNVIMIFCFVTHFVKIL
jgi:hypothetical protein